MRLRVDWHTAPWLAAGFLLVALYAFAPSWWAPYARGEYVSKQAVAEVALLVAAACLIKSRPWRWLTWWVIAGFALQYDARSMVTCWRLLLAGLAIEALASRPVNLRQVLSAWRLVTVIQTTYMLIQATGAEWLFYTTPGQNVAAVTGFLGNSTTVGAYTAMTLPLFASGRWRLWLVPTVVAIALTGSTGAVMIGVAMLLGIAGPQLRSRPREVSLLLLASVVLLVNYGRTEPLTTAFSYERGNRIMVWSDAVRIMAERPLTFLIGYGPGSFEPVFRKESSLHREYRWKRAHNEPIQAWFEFGAIGLILGMIAVLRWAIAGFESRDPSGVIFSWIFIGWLLASLYTFSAHGPPMALSGIVIVGVLEAIRRRNQTRGVFGFGSRTVTMGGVSVI